ncbi:hypothetical protein ACOMHN_040575 [Nucella lapillus]
MTPRVVCVLFWVLLNLSLSRATRTSIAAVEQSSQCSYNGLFMSEEDIRRLRGFRLPFSKMYRLSEYRRKVTQEESCGVTTVRNTPALQQCDATSLQTLVAKRSADTCQPCCSTYEYVVVNQEMSYSVPVTVTEVVSGQQVSAKHFPSSFQVLNLGHCVSEGAACGFQGTCQQATRVEWILVNDTSGDRFAAVSIPSHCTCIYT